MNIVDLWLLIATQWRATACADGRMFFHGLDYAAVRAGLDLAAATVDAAQWSGLQVMERAASAALNGVRG